MDKQAYLEEIYQAAYEDEFDKIAGVGAYKSMVAGGNLLKKVDPIAPAIVQSKGAVKASRLKKLIKLKEETVKVSSFLYKTATPKPSPRMIKLFKANRDVSGKVTKGLDDLNITPSNLKISHPDGVSFQRVDKRPIVNGKFGRRPSTKGMQEHTLTASEMKTLGIKKGHGVSFKAKI